MGKKITEKFKISFSTWKTHAGGQAVEPLYFGWYGVPFERNLFNCVTLFYLII
jgi:hypothetical protein